VESHKVVGNVVRRSLEHRIVLHCELCPPATKSGFVWLIPRPARTSSRCEFGGQRQVHSSNPGLAGDVQVLPAVEAMG